MLSAFAGLGSLGRISPVDRLKIACGAIDF